MIISESELQLTSQQIKLIESGWGSEVLNKVNVRKIVYKSDGYNVEGYLAYPGSKESKYPLIIWNRGGNREDGKIDEFLAQGMFGEIASWGYVVLTSQYRNEDEFGGSEVNDILNLIPISEDLSFCDSSRIGMEGWSRGGMMTYIVLTRTDRIKCAVIISGLSDLLRSMEKRSELSKVYRKLFGECSDAEFLRRIRQRSAVYFADKISKETKILLIHGTSDKKITFHDSEDMYNKLKENGIDSELVLIEGGDHYLRKNREQTIKLRRQWFDSNLK